MKDIFIDNCCVVENFANPLKQEYKDLIKWLQNYDPDSEDNAYLVVSNKLIQEYISSCSSSSSPTSIVLIIKELTADGRLNKISNKELKEFRKKRFSKKIENNLRSNASDRWHIPLVLLSQRKFALSNDINLLYDLVNFPKFKVTASNNPEDIPYE